LLVPGTLFLSISIGVRLLSKDLPTESGKFDIKLLGKKKVDQKKAYSEALADYRIVLMIFQYSASFGTELVMNNFLAGHFYDYFGVPLVAAGGLALGFGGMNLFARTLGGVLSDHWAKSWAMRGRLWAHYIATLGSAVGCFALGCVTDDLGWPLALLMVIIFSTFINMAEGTSYGIVPFMQPGSTEKKRLRRTSVRSLTSTT
jgi:NNP family nitrate/nitrite transporter-like MFS transporter